MQPIFAAVLNPASHTIKKNNRPAFVNRATGRAFLGKSAKLRAGERDLLLQLRSEANRNGVYKPFKCRLFMRILFYMEHITNKDGSFNQRQTDLDNMLCAPLDALQQAGVIENDNQIMKIEAEKIEAFETKVEIFLFEA